MRLIYTRFGRLVHGWLGGPLGPHVMDDFGTSIKVKNDQVILFIKN